MIKMTGIVTRLHTHGIIRLIKYVGLYLYYAI